MSDETFIPTGDKKAESIVDQLVGEGKKFATVEDLAKGKMESDAFISQLEGEAALKAEQLAALDQGKSKEATIAELIQTMKDSNKQGTEGNNQMSEEDLSKKIREIMQGESEATTKESNRAKGIKAVLDKVNGNVEAANSYVAERASQLHMSVEAITKLSEESPEAFHTLMETNVSTGTPSVVSIQGGTPPADTQLVIDGHKTKAYYDNLKKEVGASKYWTSSKIQGDYYKDAVALGDRFNS